MNQYLKTIQDLLQQNEKLPEADKEAIIKSITDADKQWSITDFKLDRTEKVKKTTAILLEETIEELEQKRKAVEAQNRELEIESSLERVRAVAMGMRKPDDLLDICEILYTELLALGFSDLRNAMINIYNDDKNSFLNYDYAVNTGKTVTVMPYNFHPLIEKQVSITKKAKDAFFEFSFTGNELKNFRELRKNNGEQDDAKLEITDALHYYFYSIGTGSIGISTYSPISEEKLKLLKRFRNVFILSYQRYADIRQAEAQARESQIQLALERIRARTMAMQRSDELIDAAEVLFKQLEAFGVHPWGCACQLWEENMKAVTSWTFTKGFRIPPFRMPVTEDPLMIHVVNAAQRGEDLYVEEMNGKVLEDHYSYMKSLPVIKEELEKLAAAGFPNPTYQIVHTAFFSNGYLIFITHELCPQIHDIFIRSAKVFEQTYTRFLDLQKAEALAREGQIELGLERVRARAMAMQHSDELKELIGTVYAELTKLNISLDRCLIWVMNSDDFSAKLWMAGAGSLPVSFYVPYHENPPYLAFVKGWKERNTKWDYDLGGQIKKDWDEFVFSNTEMKHLPDPVKKGMRASERIIMAGSFQKFGCLQTAGPEPLKEEQFEVLNRFAKVFDSTYTRFNDLQKAEAQAREAKIEAALERVRSRAMAMHKTDQLLDAAELVYKELTLLGITSMAISYAFVNEQEKNALYYGINPVDGKIPPVPFVFPHTETDVMCSILSSWKKKPVD